MDGYEHVFLRFKIIIRSTLSNPNVSNEAKMHARDMLNKISGDQARDEIFQARGNQNKDPVRVSAGLKA